MNRRFSSLLVTLCVLAGCTGPRPPLEIGVKEYATEVLLGSNRVQAVPPPPSLGPVVGFPGFIQPPPPPDLGEPDPIPKDCPAAHPFDAPRLPAFNRALKPPVAATYTYRNAGTFDVRGPNPRRGPYPQLTTRQVANVISSPNEYTFDVVFDQGERKTTTSYRVVPQSLVPPAVGSSPDSGIFITKVLTEIPGKEPRLFTPRPELPILLFPVVIGLQFDARGIDPVSQAVMQFHGTVMGKMRVDACGTVLDSWHVAITDGHIDGPTKDLDFTADYAIGTQFGGISLYDRIQLSGIDDDEALQSENHSTITSEPKEPEGGASAQ